MPHSGDMRGSLTIAMDDGAPGRGPNWPLTLQVSLAAQAQFSRFNGNWWLLTNHPDGPRSRRVFRPCICAHTLVFLTIRITICNRIKIMSRSCRPIWIQSPRSGMFCRRHRPSTRPFCPCTKHAISRHRGNKDPAHIMVEK